MARWLLLCRIAGLEKHGARPRPHQRGFLDGKTRGRRIQRHGETHGLGKTDDREKDAISDRPRGKSNSQYRTGQVPGGGQGAAGGRAREKKPPDTVSMCREQHRQQNPDRRSWTGGKNHRGSPRGVVKRASATGAWSSGDPMMDGSRWRRTPGHGQGPLADCGVCSLPFRVGSGHWAPSLSLPAILRRRTRQLLVGASPVHLKSRKAHLFSGGPWTASVKNYCRAFSSFGPSFPAVWSSSLLTSSPPPPIPSRHFVRMW